MLPQFNWDGVKNSRAGSSGPLVGTVSEAGYVLGLEPLRPFANLELDCLALSKRPVPLRLNGGVVNEDVLACLTGDEPIALRCVEPLDCALFSHFCCFLFP